MDFFNKTQSLKSRLLTNLALLIILPFALVMGVNYNMTTSQLEKRIVDDELPVLSNTLHKAVEAKLNIPATLCSGMARNIFVQQWIENGEEDIQTIREFLAQNEKTGGLKLSNVLSEKTGRIYTKDGFFRELDKENPIDQWYFEYVSSPANLQLVLSAHDDGTIMLFLDDKIRNESGELLGVIGLGLDMSELAETLVANQVGEKGRNLLVDGNGKNMLGQGESAQIATIKEEAGLGSVASSILSKKDGVYTYEKEGQKYLVNVRYFPEYDWYVIAEACLDELIAPINTFYRNIILIGLLVFALVLVTAYYFTDRLVKPIAKASTVAQNIVDGKFDENIDTYSSIREINELNKGFGLLKKALEQTTHFAEQIAEGNLEVKFVNVGEEAALSRSLINMRDELKRVEEEGRQRNWVTEGIAKFSELLRQSDRDLDSLGEQLITELVRYIDANQGGMFVLNTDENNKSLELIACYAYNRKKYLHKTIGIGEGLVGQAYLEKDTIYMTDVPDEYVRIRSGLGDATPRAVLIVPMKLNEEVLGVLELASFAPFKQYQIEFIEKVGEAIASTLTMVRNNEKMRSLLEESQLQAETMKAQEEEMRQNMEEMQATQEEVARKEQEYLKRIEELENQQV